MFQICFLTFHFVTVYNCRMWNDKEYRNEIDRVWLRIQYNTNIVCQFQILTHDRYSTCVTDVTHTWKDHTCGFLLGWVSSQSKTHEYCVDHNRWFCHQFTQFRALLSEMKDIISTISVNLTFPNSVKLLRTHLESNIFGMKRGAGDERDLKSRSSSPNPLFIYGFSRLYAPHVKETAHWQAQHFEMERCRAAFEVYDQEFPML